MTTNAWIQIGLFLGALLACVKPLGWYMARIYEGQYPGCVRWIKPVEERVYRLCGVETSGEMSWKTYSTAVIWFSFVSFLSVYALQRCQGMLPLNPMNMPAVSPDSAFNTASSFATNKFSFQV